MCIEEAAGRVTYTVMSEKFDNELSPDARSVAASFESFYDAVKSLNAAKDRGINQQLTVIYFSKESDF